LDPTEYVGYYARFHDGEALFDIEAATRYRTRRGPFSTGVRISLNDSSSDLSPSLAADGSVLYFERREENEESEEKDVWKIHQRLWDKKSQSFGTVVVVSPLGPKEDNHSDGGPYTTGSGDVLYFHSDYSTGGLFRAEGVGTSFAQGAKVPITFPGALALTTSYPVVSPDELTLYFAARDGERPTDVWKATRATMDESFGEATPVVEVNTADANEVPSFISEDGCRLYFDRNTNVPLTWDPPSGNSFIAEREPDSE
jgi:hypothetical protein